MSDRDDEQQQAVERLDAYILTPEGTFTVAGGGWLDVEDEGVVVIREQRGGRPLAAVAVTDETWVTIGRPPYPLAQPAHADSEDSETVWPPEPPPDVDGPVSADLRRSGTA